MCTVFGIDDSVTPHLLLYSALEISAESRDEKNASCVAFGVDAHLFNNSREAFMADTVTPSAF